MRAGASRARIITFYSYKGGTGRTMALANAAWILASRGKRVLIVDWDLEAPGLHRYFHPFLPDKELLSSPGVMDLVWEFATAATDPATPDEPDWHETLAEIEPYALSVEHDFPERGAIDLIPAGRQDHLYSSLVTTFDWNNFYERLGGGGFIEALKRTMREHYDFILIDSRTGLSDTAGICTVQFPDILVNCFTLSNQAIDGAEAVAASVDRQRAGDQLRMFPVPMRVENGEADRLEHGRRYAQSTFGRYLSHVDDPERYWGDVEVPYRPIYAYEEVLAAVRDQPGHPGSLLAASERLVSYLTDGDVPESEPLEESVRQDLLRQFTRNMPLEPAALTGLRYSDERGKRVFITYAFDSPAHFEAVRELWYLLRDRGIDARLDLPPGQRQEDWPQWQREQLLRAELVLPVASAEYGRLPDDEVIQLRDVYYTYPARFLPVVLPNGSTDGLPGFLVPSTRKAQVTGVTAEGVAPVAELISRRAPAEAATQHDLGDSGRGWDPLFLESEFAEARDMLAEEVYWQLNEELNLRRADGPDLLPLRWTLSRRLVSRADPGRMAMASGDLLTDPGGLFASVPNGRLVLLGAAGSGKTTAAYRLALALLVMRRKNHHLPVPVMLPMASWDPNVLTLTDWIVDCLRRDHPGLLRTLERDGLERLVAGGGVLPFLDGLDELPRNSHTMAIKALNRSMAGTYVLTSRTAAYESAVRQIGLRLGQATVVELEPLEADDALRYLSQGLLEGDGRWGPVFSSLRTQSSRPLAQVLKTPFMLQLAAEVYREPSTDPAELLVFPDSGQIETHLLDALISTAYRGDHPFDAPPEKGRRWLSYLAAHMDRLGTVDFAWWELHRALSPWGMRLLLWYASLLFAIPLVALDYFARGGIHIDVIATLCLTTVLMLSAPQSPLPGSVFFAPSRLAPKSASPRASLRSDRRRALFALLGAGTSGTAISLALSLATSFSLISSVVVPLFLTLLLGTTFVLHSSAAARYAVTVYWLAACRRTPLRLMRFLEDAHVRGVLRRSGAVYRFPHVRLQRELAKEAGQPNP
ncbi:AAA family ATPase [Streptomyces sp. NBC_00663]|uniref:KGGVGR-motif variant AAA ATPase n=1 Tax=Streptomyces sp. NBC_00663 TaxID=2975801 RepID=UPI002E2EE923|nr:AAA family ATPase [Streptomyces sp. NBC_00663]